MHSSSTPSSTWLANGALPLYLAQQHSVLLPWQRGQDGRTLTDACSLSEGKWEKTPGSFYHPQKAWAPQLSGTAIQVTGQLSALLPVPFCQVPGVADGSFLLCPIHLGEQALLTSSRLPSLQESCLPAHFLTLQQWDQMIMLTL